MMIALYKTNRSGNMNYYYIHDYQGNLFSPHTFTVLWGRNLSAGKEKSYTFHSRGEMDEKLKLIFKKRVRDGYKILYSYPQENNTYQSLLQGIIKQRIS